MKTIELPKGMPLTNGLSSIFQGLTGKPFKTVDPKKLTESLHRLEKMIIAENEIRQKRLQALETARQQLQDGNDKLVKAIETLEKEKQQEIAEKKQALEKGLEVFTKGLPYPLRIRPPFKF